MTPEETMKKAIEIAQKNGYKFNHHDGEFLGIDYEVILFSRSFRESLVGKEFVYPKAMEFSTTGYLRCGHMIYQNPPEITIEMSIADYHLMMCAKSDDRIGYFQSVLDSLENK